MGRKIVLTGTTLTDTTAPKLATIDLILPESGALLFLDPSHPVTGGWNGAPLTDGTNVPNVAYGPAKALIPAGTATTLGASIIKDGGFADDGVTSKVEMTTKGGLHVILSQAGAPAGAFRVKTGLAIRDYIQTNKAHAFYTALWGRVTRRLTAGYHLHGRYDGSYQLFGFATRRDTGGATEFPAANQLGAMGENAIATTSNVPLFQDVGVSTANGLTTGQDMYPLLIGGASGGMPGSLILYGFYVEDLTVSGRSYTDAHDAVYGKYTRDVLTPGGRYYGDTFTDPATIP